jgi:hypothetical protein
MQESTPMSRTTYRMLLLIAAVALAQRTVWLHAMRPAPANNIAANTVTTGTWGGEHIILEVSEKGTEAEFDCAHGEITQPMVLDKNGDFDVAGTFTPEHGGPVLRDEAPSTAPARYSGHVEGKTMKLTITLEKETAGSFTLTYDSRPMLRKCR